MLVLAVFISVVLHVAVLWGLYDVPLGRVDMHTFSREQTFRLVRRSADDMIVQPATPPILPEHLQEEKAPSIEEASLALLGESTGPHPPEPEALQMEMGQVQDQRSFEPPAEGEIPIDLVHILDERLLEPMLGVVQRIPGGAEPIVNIVAERGGGASRARLMLKDMGLLVTQNPLPPVRPHVDELGPIVDQAVIDTAPARPALDLADLALADTTRLDIPEHLDEDFDYQLSIYLDRKARRPPNAYFRIDISTRRSLRKLPTMPKDVVYLIDVSESMRQEWVDQAVRGVKQSFASLNRNDRFNIVLFNDRAATLSPLGPMVATERNLSIAGRFLADTKAQGYTDVNRALSRLLVRDLQVERVYDIILISDGRPTRGVLDTRDLINLVTRDNDLVASIYCVAVGAKPNAELLNFLAYRNRGFSVVVDNLAETDSTIRDLLSRLRYPIMKSVRLTTVGLDSREVYPVDLPNIHQGERFQIFGTFAQSSHFTMHVAGRNGHRQLDFTNPFNLYIAARGDADIATDWAFWKLHHLYSRIIQEGERPEIMDDIEMLRKRYKLKTLY